MPKKRPSPAFVLAAISLFISLSAGAYAISLGRGVVRARNIRHGAVRTVKLADGAVTTVKLADGSVTTGKIVDKAVTSPKLAGNAVDSSKVADGSLLGSDIATGTITGGNILDSSIGGADLGAGSVDTAQLASRAVSPAKVGTIPTVRARRTTAQTIAPGSFVPINLTAETWDTANMHNTASGNTKLVAPISGTYLITANVSWVSDNTGERELEITLTSFTESDKPIALVAQSADLPEAPQGLSTVYQLGQGSFVEALVKQTSAASQQINASSSGAETSPEVSMTWLGPSF
jgi:hypothetical protein